MQLTNGLITPLAVIKNNPAATATTVGNNDFLIEQQQMSNWCWAAASVAMCNFYGTPGPFTQQAIVANVLNMSFCEFGPLNPVCNNTADFSDALTFITHLQAPTIEEPVEAGILQAQLANNNPVGCQMNLPGIGGHVVVVVAMTTDASGQVFVTVADPADGTLPTMTYTQLRNNYRGSGGQWIRTYLTN